MMQRESSTRREDKVVEQFRSNKKGYVSPRILILGDIEELTQVQSGQAPDLIEASIGQVA